MRSVLMGSRPVFAPETDEGLDHADPDDLETPEPAGDSDEELDDAEDEPLDEEPTDDLDEGGEPPVAETRPTRGANRIQTLAAERAAATARAEALERELAELRNTRQQADREAAQRAERERLDSMEPAERLEYQMNQRLARIEFQSWDANDRVAFEAKAAANPAVGRLKDEVEQLFQQQAAKGQPLNRETIAAYLIGQRALNAAPRARAAGKRASEASRERNTARPASGRGDVATPRGRNQDSRAARIERLKDVTF